MSIDSLNPSRRTAGSAPPPLRGRCGRGGREAEFARDWGGSPPSTDQHDPERHKVLKSFISQTCTRFTILQIAVSFVKDPDRDSFKAG